jgi:hypothetical protein
MSLKALASKHLARNKARNSNATATPEPVDNSPKTAQQNTLFRTPFVARALSKSRIPPSPADAQKGAVELIRRWLAPSADHSAEALDRVRVWLEALGESDPVTAKEVLDLCRADPATMAYYARRAAEPLPDHPPASEADIQHADMVRDRIDAGWVWSEGRWHEPGALKAEGGPSPHVPHGTTVKCSECRHTRPVDFHPTLAGCGVGMESGNPTRAFWSSDLRTCSLFKNDGGAT